MKEDNIPLNQYPRPQLKRDSYLCLNGYWDYAFRDSDEFPHQYDGEILVPYSPESSLSGVNRFLSPHEYLFYHRTIKFEKDFVKDFIIIHFGAVDQICDVYFNNNFITNHIGGYLPFEIIINKEDIKEINHLSLRVKDYSDTSYHSRGKQKIKRGGIWYTPTSGIYMPVWVESVSKGYISNIKITPNIDNCSVNITVYSTSEEARVNIENESYNIKTNVENVFKIKDLHLWSPEDPFLYDISLETKVDKVTSYFAMRKFSKIIIGNFYRLALNNNPYFMKGILDQGYYQEGILTPTKYEDYENDLKLIKELGFNTVRKHIKIESLIWYHLCDKMGLIVWQDFVNGGTHYKFSTISFPLITDIHHNDHHYLKFSRTSLEGRNEFKIEATQTIELLYNVPSIGLWTIFNEGWGQFDSKEIYQYCLSLDSSRLYDHASGWHDQGISDVKSMHVYFKPVTMPTNKKIKDRAIILSEAGGYNLGIPNHKFNDTNFGYKHMKDATELIKQYKKFIMRDVLANIEKGLSAFIYTQLSDVEDELNGFITYDRKYTKLDPERIKKINDLLKY